MLIWPLWYCGHFILAKSKVQSVIFFLFVKEPLPYGLAINTDNFFCGQWMTELKESRVAGALETKTRIWHFKSLDGCTFWMDYDSV